MAKELRNQVGVPLPQRTAAVTHAVRSGLSVLPIRQQPIAPNPACCRSLAACRLEVDGFNGRRIVQEIQRQQENAKNERALESLDSELNKLEGCAAPRLGRRAHRARLRQQPSRHSGCRPPKCSTAARD